jgi:SAM-dependent methyltransferase
VLVAGAGGGREVIALAQLGHEVTAFDSSPRLADACRRNLELAGYSAVVLDALPSRLPDGLGTFDGVLIGRGVYHHISGRGRRIEFLEGCLAHLSAGSPIIVSDFFTREPGSVFHRRVRAIASPIRTLRGSKEQVELGDWLSDCMQHAFTREEFEQELADAGIQVVVYAVSPFSEASQLAHAVGRVAEISS